MDLVDLRACTSPGPIMRIMVDGQPWIVTRRARMRRFGSSDDTWIIDAPLLRRATTAVHLTAFAMHLLLARVSLYGADGSVKFHGSISGMTGHNSPRIRASGEQCFFVPPPGYDPLRDAQPCPRCPKGKWHPVVAACYPPHDPELFGKVRGLSVDVEFGATP